MSRFILPKPVKARRDDRSAVGQFDVLGNKIPRPMNAFMIFGNQHRPRLKARMPTLTNKEISVKLGEMWSNMQPEEKEVYFRISKQEERHHFQMYPDYRYLPNKKPMGDMRPADDISPPFRGYMPEYTDQDYYGDYEFQSSHASSDPRASDYQQPRKKHKVQPLLEPTAPNVFQIARPRRLNKRDLQHDLDQYGDHGEESQVRSSYEYPYSSKQPLFSSRFIQSVYRQTPRHRYNQTSSERERFSMQSQPTYQLGSREKTQYYVRNQEDYGRNQHHEVADNYIYQGSNLDLDEEDQDDECRRAVASLASELQEDTENSNGGIADEETNYVMIPCDVNIARMLGWPVHLLQRVSQSMLARIQAESVKSLELQMGSRTGNNAAQSPDSFMEPSSTLSPPSSSETIPNQENSKMFQVDSTYVATDESKQHTDNKHTTKTKMEQSTIDNNNNKISEDITKSTSMPDGEKDANMSVSYDKTNNEVKGMGSVIDDHTQRSSCRVQLEFPLHDRSVALGPKIPCPMDSDFKVFPSSESEDELESIDTSSMSASFGQMDSDSIAAYQLSNSQGSDKISTYTCI